MRRGLCPIFRSWERKYEQGIPDIKKAECGSYSIKVAIGDY